MADGSMDGSKRLFDRLEEQKSDSLLQLIQLCNADEREDKIDVGVGVYRDAGGGTPILRSVKAAERRLWETQETKTYLGSAGDTRFAELIKPIVFGDAAAGDERIVGIQTPGGCGALRLGADLVVEADEKARIFVGQPTWPNHGPLIECAGVEMVDHPYYERDSHRILFDEMISALDPLTNNAPVRSRYRPKFLSQLCATSACSAASTTSRVPCASASRPCPRP